MRSSGGSLSPLPVGSSASQGSDQPSNQLDLSALPPTYILPVRLPLSELHELEARLIRHGLPLTYDALEANVFLGMVGTKRRAEFELRCHGLWTTQDDSQRSESGVRSREADEDGLPRKRRKISNSMNDANGVSEGAVRVVALRWFEESLAAGTLLPMTDFLIYEGRHITRPADAVTPERPREVRDEAGHSGVERPVKKSPILKKGEFKRILERAKANAENPSSQQQSNQSARRQNPRPINGPKRDGGLALRGSNQSQPPRLLHQTTSEHDAETDVQLPEMPRWVKEKKKYACERSTPSNSPNIAFIEQLKEIKQARLLTGDEIGVRAYSTSIASLAAYPHSISSTKEILALPGCDAKIALLFEEWRSREGEIQAVTDISRDETLRVLHLFYDIWGVGAKTAREFYHDKGWRDLDDIVEYGWNSLSRVQQIGVKYYEEFLQKIPRAEVESIGDVITEHARRITSDGTIEACIVGGYRRGKAASGDVDIVLSHHDESQTLALVQDIVISLEKDGWITHTLLLSLTGSKRNQQPLPYRGGGGGDVQGAGFDTLDKALVVWQDPDWPTKANDMAAAAAEGSGKVKNPNIHRRVDIIIAPWRTVGCAIVGWSGGTTFQRDLRRYAKNVRGLKFDSSGIRDRTTGRVVDLEGRGGPAKTWMEAERKVFEGMGLAYREPEERCTG